MIQAGLEDAWIAVRKVRWREAWRDVWGMCLRDLGDWQGSGRSVGEGGVRGGSQASSLALGVLVVQFRDGTTGRVTCFEGTRSPRGRCLVDVQVAQTGWRVILRPGALG